MAPQKGLISTSNEVPSEPISIQEIIDSINKLDTKLLEIAEKAKELKVDNLKDSRMLFIRYIAELNSITIFQLSFQAESSNKLEDKNWIKQRVPHLSQRIDAISDIEGYSNNRNKNISKHIRECFFLGYFNEFETRIRSFVRTIGNIVNVNSTKNRNKLDGDEPFYLIYRGLYESYLNYDKSEYEVLKIFSAIRNTVHNSGFYFSKNSEGKAFNYKNESYLFRHGEPVSFLDFNLMETIQMDLLCLFLKTINDERIKRIKLIEDPISSVKFTGIE
jgi:hypothetical protein